MCVCLGAPTKNIRSIKQFSHNLASYVRFYTLHKSVAVFGGSDDDPFGEGRGRESAVNGFVVPVFFFPGAAGVSLNYSQVHFDGISVCART